MSKLAQVLQVYSPSKGKWENVPLYTTTKEAAAYGACKKCEAGGVTCYFPLGPAGNSYQTDFRLTGDETVL